VEAKARAENIVYPQKSWRSNTITDRHIMVWSPSMN